MGRTQACSLSAESLERDGHMPKTWAVTRRPGVQRGGQGEWPGGGGTAVLSVSHPPLQRGSPGSNGFFLADIRHPGEQGPRWPGGAEGSEDIGQLFCGLLSSEIICLLLIRT